MAVLTVGISLIIELKLAAAGSAAIAADRPTVQISIVSEDGKPLANVPVVGVGLAANTGQGSIPGTSWRI